jgi:predicted metal-binding membrane protein
MKPVLRTLWICLLLLALPVQGFAAAQMAQCGPGHGPMRHASTGGHEHEPHAQVQDQHEYHVHAAAHADEAPSDASTPPAKHHCSACAACCVGMALPSSAPVVIAPADAVRHGVATAVADPIFLTSGLERPPRSPLA